MDHDILISGGGLAGLSAAAAFGAVGFDVMCVDPAPPVTERNADGSDLRTTAILQPGRDFLEEAGVWTHFAPHAMPLQIMRIIDAGGVEAEPRVTREFDADDISDRPFGWNLPNWLLRRELLARLEELPNVRFETGVAATDLFTRSSEARVRLSDGRSLRAKLAIAADGRNSAPARGGWHRRVNDALRAKGTGLCRHPSAAASECLDRDPPHRRAFHARAPARP